MLCVPLRHRDSRSRGDKGFHFWMSPRRPSKIRFGREPMAGAVHSRRSRAASNRAWMRLESWLFKTFRLALHIVGGWGGTEPSAKDAFVTIKYY